VVGGLVVSQTLTLYVTPVFYIYMERMQEWLYRRRATAGTQPQGSAGAGGRVDEVAHAQR
jgi:hypothetical protein